MEKNGPNNAMHDSSQEKPIKTLQEKLKKKSITEILGEETLEKVLDDFFEKRLKEKPNYSGQGWF